jgi:hypothetical protein
MTNALCINVLIWECVGVGTPGGFGTRDRGGVGIPGGVETSGGVGILLRLTRCAVWRAVCCGVGSARRQDKMCSLFLDHSTLDDHCGGVVGECSRLGCVLCVLWARCALRGCPRRAPCLFHGVACGPPSKFMTQTLVGALSSTCGRRTGGVSFGGRSMGHVYVSRYGCTMLLSRGICLVYQMAVHAIHPLTHIRKLGAWILCPVATTSSLPPLCPFPWQVQRQAQRPPLSILSVCVCGRAFFGMHDVYTSCIMSTWFDFGILAVATSFRCCRPRNAT